MLLLPEVGNDADSEQSTDRSPALLSPLRDLHVWRSSIHYAGMAAPVDSRRREEEVRGYAGS
jgi:hypothetical protein